MEPGHDRRLRPRGAAGDGHERLRVEDTAQVDADDLRALRGLLPAVHDEFGALCFDTDGAVLHAETGQPMPEFSLVDGTHGRSGAHYRIVNETPRMELPAHLEREFNDASLAQIRAGATPDERAAQAQLRSDAMVQVGVDVTTTDVHLLAHDKDGLRVRLAEPWAVEIALEAGPPSRIEATGEVAVADVASQAPANRSPGWIQRWVLGHARGQARLDVSAVDDGGRLLDLSVSLHWFDVEATVDVDVIGAAAEVRGVAEVAGRGLGRLIQTFGARVARRLVEQLFDDEEGVMAGLRTGLAELSTEVNSAGGPAPYVHRSLWGPDPGPDASTAVWPAQDA